MKSTIKKTLYVLFSILTLAFFSPQYTNAADWTFMVYLDADNNLENAGIDDFLEMSSVGSDSHVNIVVQFDRIPGYDSSFDNWTDCQRFLVTQGMVPRVTNAISDWGDGKGGREVNMADPQTLVNFVEWAIDNYPADNYALVLWNHGGGWRDKADPKMPIFKAVCWDDTSGYDSLYMSEVRSALTTIKTERQQIDLVGFDACLMSMTEVAYEIKDLASVMVASEETEPGDGWPYNTILADLTSAPTMPPSVLGATIVDRYGEFYWNIGDTTQSALDLQNLDILTASVSDFAVAMMESSCCGEIRNARSGSQEYYYPEHTDLYHFADLIASGVPDTAVGDAAEDVKQKIEDTVIAEFHGTLLRGSHGVAIYLPRSQAEFDPDYNGLVIEFPGNTQWDEFLSWFYTCTPECDYAYHLQIIANEFAGAGIAQGWKADDASWQYVLPFTFSYFGTDYNKVWVCSNGFLDFSSSNAAYHNTGDEFKNRAMIAPLWDDLRTDRPGCDIYIHQPTQDSVCFRWLAREYADGGLVNVEAILYQDGRIKFNYGEKNITLTPTRGISGENGACYLFSPYSSSSTLTDQDTNLFTPGYSNIQLFIPDDGAVLPDSPPATFAWEADPMYRFKIEFSPSSSFVCGFPTLTVPRRFWMPATSTDTIPVDAWQRKWEIIKRIEQRNGIVYWRVLGKPGPTASAELSKIRSFMIE